MTTHLAEDVIRDGWDGPKYEGPVFMDVHFSKEGTVVTVGLLNELEYPKSPLRGDIDNYLKLVMDGLNGSAYEDDVQVRYIKVTKL
jgi:Holliday junction resolvase RusA-like endonuclease